MGEKKAKKPRSHAVTVVKRAGTPAEPRAVSGGPPGPWERELDRFWDEFRRPFSLPRLWGAERWWPSVPAMLRPPAVDVYEDGDQIIVKADIPGLSKDDIEVNVTDSTLTIKGEKRKEEEVKEKDYYRSERSFGAFSRSIVLPAEVKTEQAKATFVNGVLEVRLPKSEGAKHKVINVQVA